LKKSSSTRLRLITSTFRIIDPFEIAGRRFTPIGPPQYSRNPARRGKRRP
jgi:hypothetical protein